MLKVVYVFVMLCHPLAINKNYCINDFSYKFETLEDCTKAAEMTKDLYPEEEMACVIRYIAPIETEI